LISYVTHSFLRVWYTISTMDLRSTDDITYSAQATAIVFDNHERNKHHLNCYATGTGSLEWADQTDPFRRIKGCELIPLPGASLPLFFVEQPDTIPCQPLNRDGLGPLTVGNPLNNASLQTLPPYQHLA
jgi:hypothetical protein